MGMLRSAGLSASAVATAILLIGCAANSTIPAEAPGAVSGWSRADDFPLSARTEPTLGWSGSEVLVIGGDTGPPCPRTADCGWTALARDGAAFDPISGTWREIRDAPIEIPPSSAAFVSDRLFISVVGATGEVSLVSYDVHADRWNTWDTPDRLPRALVADGDRVLFVSGTDEQGISADLVLDVMSGEWSELPPDPLGPAFDRTITATPAGLVLTAKELVAAPGSDGPSLTTAALYDRQTGGWSRLPDTGQIGGWHWMWTGSRLVDPQLGGADGGRVGNWQRTYPYGGSLALPTGAWSPLPDPPEPLQNAWLRDVVTSSGRFALSDGYLYDDALSSWTAVGEPEDAQHDGGPAIWAAEKLVVVGETDGTASGGTVSRTTWIYTPPPERHR
ncbi:hypothetical protein [Microbacterium allomyrinae]|uniref:Galactose oxidase n=1 Tax=Microbacterium allomyrinae TaxID=2830666 RepID=A0A9X1S581_9MICO|nr:hypothetical protein [Microbacterium allomyrinae]MCC2033943.1 hypothetical protein [Microbacterium allomyrinae]